MSDRLRRSAVWFLLGCLSIGVIDIMFWQPLRCMMDYRLTQANAGLIAGLLAALFGGAALSGLSPDAKVVLAGSLSGSILALILSLIVAIGLPPLPECECFPTSPCTPTTTIPPISPTPPTATPTLTPNGPTPTRVPRDTIGKSVEERDIEVAIIGEGSEAAVVVVGSIQGDQINTRDLIESLVDDLWHERDRIPAQIAFHLIPTLNPDGNFAGKRRNAHNVDLNRNWSTSDWTANPDQPDGVVEGAGGSHPHSEPETQSLADHLLSLHRQNTNLRLVLLHSSKRLSSGGEVYPGRTASGWDQSALSLAHRYAEATGYTVKVTWDPYETTGELITWCAEQKIAAIDVVIPGSLSGLDRKLRDKTMEALLEIAQFPQPRPNS